MSDEEKKIDIEIEVAEPGDPQCIEEGVETNESNLREKFAEVGGFDVDDPLEEGEHRKGFAIPSTADEIADAKSRWGDGSWQMKLLAFINSDFVQKFLVGLLVLDVLVLFVELGESLSDEKKKLSYLA